MGRLTKYGKTSHENGVCYTHFMSKECKEVGGECSYGCKWEEEAWSKLAHYEDMEEQGRLIELPCAVGDTVWQITRNFISEFKIKSFICDNEGIFFYWECINGIYINILGFSDNRIGKDVFLTKEEAETKLKELEGVKE